jgi:hypothetical protein
VTVAAAAAAGEATDVRRQKQRATPRRDAVAAGERRPNLMAGSTWGDMSCSFLMNGVVGMGIEDD